MVQAIVDFGENEDRIISIIKAKFGFKNKSDTVNFVISAYDAELMEPELRPEFVQKIQQLDKKGKFTTYKTTAQLRKEIENA